MDVVVNAGADGAAAAVAAVAIDRFGAMLFEQYGGRKAIREVIRTDRLVQVKLGQGQLRQRAEIPQRRPRHSRAKQAEVRAKCCSRLVGILPEAGVAAASSAEVERRRLLRIMKRRQDALERGMHHHQPIVKCFL